jgi:hypothetical protein
MNYVDDVDMYYLSEDDDRSEGDCQLEGDDQLGIDDQSESDDQWGSDDQLESDNDESKANITETTASDANNLDGLDA